MAMCAMPRSSFCNDRALKKKGAAFGRPHKGAGGLRPPAPLWIYLLRARSLQKLLRGTAHMAKCLGPQFKLELPFDLELPFAVVMAFL